jgi:NADH dehydrogenase/NADH:ubiquinone oxidoreductase subunit G
MMIITIDDKQCQAERGEYILDIARRYNIHIPTLCHSDALPGQGNCRLCIVEIIDRGKKRIVTSCTYPITREIEVITNSPHIIKMRGTLIKLLLSRARGNECLNTLAKECGIVIPAEANTALNCAAKAEGKETLDAAKDNCILCGLCVRACEKLGSHAISTVFRGIKKKVSTPYDEPASACIGCGSCASVCPTNAIKMTENNGKRTIWNKTFEMIQCQRCGKYIFTKEQLSYLIQKGVSPESLQLCDDCKQKAIGNKMKDIYDI